MNLRGSESGDYLLSPDAISAVPSAMLCLRSAALRSVWAALPPLSRALEWGPKNF